MRGGGVCSQVREGGLCSEVLSREDVKMTVNDGTYKNLAHIRQSMPDSGLGFQVKFLQPF